MKSVPTLILVVVLSLTTWFVFYELRMPLNPSETAIDAGFWIVMVLSAKWLWSRFLLTRGSKQNHGPK